MRKQKGKPRGVTITWYGHSAFAVQSPGGKLIVVDPWLQNPNAPADAMAISGVDLILVTHGHSDHVGNTVEIAHTSGAMVVGIYELSLYFMSKGLKNVTGMNKGGTIVLDGLAITMVDARHSCDIDVDGKTVAPGGEAAGFVIRLENGFSVYHAGDTSLFGDMKFIGKLYEPDVALLPIGDVYTMGPREAAIACDLLKPRTIIGMHYGTFPSLTGTPALLRKHLHTKFKSRVLELTPGVPVML